MDVPGVCKDTGYKDNGFGSGNAPDSVNRSDSDNDGSLDSGGTARKRGGNGVGIGIAMLITIIMALASGIIQLMAAVHFVPGFEIHGKLTYIILALLMAVFSIEEKKEA